MQIITDFTSTIIDAPIGFEHAGCSEGLFTRYLTSRGERAYELSFKLRDMYILACAIDECIASPAEIDQVISILTHTDAE